MALTVHQSAFAQTQPPVSNPADHTIPFDLAGFWSDAFGVEYVPGQSALLISQAPPGGSPLARVFDPDQALDAQDADDFLINPGQFAVVARHPADWLDEETISFNNTESDTTYSGVGSFRVSSTAVTLITATGSTYHLSGFSGEITVYISQPVQEVVTVEVFVPAVRHTTWDDANALAYWFAVSVPGALDLPDFVADPESLEPGAPDSDMSRAICAEGCLRDWDLARQQAQSNFQTAKANCGPPIGGAAAGCGIYAVIWAPLTSPAGGAICCVIGGAGGAIIQYLDCLYDAGRDHANALETAKLSYISCMERCGFIIAEE